MKEVPSPNRTEVAVIVRLITALLAVGAVAVANPWLHSPSNSFLTYQTIGVLLSIAAFSLTFEQHFSDYWQTEAAAFLGLSLLVWTAMAFAANPLPLKGLTLAIPIITVLLPWNWQIQFGICGLCVAAAIFETRVESSVTGYQSLWMIVAGESIVAVLAGVQLERQRSQEDAYFQALIADEEQFRALIENAPDGLTVLNRMGNIVFQNPSARQLLGAEELTGRSIYEFLHQDDAPSFGRLISECLNFPDRSPEMTVKFRHAGGSWRTIAGRARQLPNYRDAALVVLNWRDVTDRVLQEARVQQSEEKFRKIFQYSTNAISLISRSDGRFLDVNEEWLRLFGYTRAEIIGRDPLELGRWADSDAYLRYAAELLAKGEIRDRTAVFRAKDGSPAPGLISSVIIETNEASLVLSLISVPSAADSGAP